MGFEKVSQTLLCGVFVGIGCVVQTTGAVTRTAAADSRPATNASPYPPSPVIAGMELDWSTHRRSAPGSDNFQLTWADDGHQYGAWGDGGGFGGTNGRGRVGLGVARVEGTADNYRGFNVWGGENAPNPATFDGKSWGMISIRGSLFMWVVPDKPVGKPYRNHYEYIQLARSTDHGANWTRADWKFHQTEDLSIPTFLNFGRDNAGVPDQWDRYVYSYFVRPENRSMEQEGPEGAGLIVHQPGHVYLARVPISNMFDDKGAYEFFRGLTADGRPQWGQVSEKQAVFSDPAGVGWCMSASYIDSLGRVLLCTEHGISKRGMLGVFDAPAPWGPWTTVEYYSREKPFGSQREGSQLDWNHNVFFAAFPTKWIDRTGFTLTFTGAGNGKDNDSFNTVRGRFVLPPVVR